MPDDMERKRKLSLAEFEEAEQTSSKSRRKCELPPLQWSELKSKISGFSSSNPFSDEEFIQIHKSFFVHDNQLLIMSKQVEWTLWNAHYATINSYRSRLSIILKTQESSVPRRRTVGTEVSTLSRFIEKAAFFYKRLVRELRVRHGLNGESWDRWDCEKPDPRLPCISYRLLLRLGDLFRYCLRLNRPTFEDPRLFYQQAYNVRYCDGAAHMRLALCAQDRVHAVYHYLRSMFVKCPAPSGRANLESHLTSQTEGFAAKTTKKLKFFHLFCELAHILLLKVNKLSEVGRLLKQSLRAFRKGSEAMAGIRVVIILVSSVEDYYSGAISGKTELSRNYLLQSVKAALNFAVLLVTLTLQNPAKTMLPAVAVFFVWLANQPQVEDIVQATMGAEENRKVFLDLLRDTESLLQGLALPSQHSVPRNLDSKDSSNEGVWEDEELRGFTLVNLENHDVMEAGYSEEQLNCIRSHRLEASLRIITKYAGCETSSELRVQTLEEVNPTVQGFFSLRDNSKDETVASVPEQSQQQQQQQEQQHAREEVCCKTMYSLSGRVDQDNGLEEDKLEIPSGALLQMKARMASCRNRYETRNPFVFHLSTVL